MKFTMFSYFNQRISEMGMVRAVQAAREYGFSSVELLGNTTPGAKNIINDLLTAKYLRKVLDEHEMTESCYSVLLNFLTHPNAEEMLIKHIQYAAELGSPFVHHTVLPSISPKVNGPDYYTAVNKAIECSIRCAEYADTLGITCLYEDQGSYVNGVEGFGYFYGEMKKNCKNVGVCADLGNILFADETPEDFLKAFIQDVRHVHVKDYLRKENVIAPKGNKWSMTNSGKAWLRDTVIGDGVVDFAACLRILKDAGYSGSFALENTHPELYEEGTKLAMERLTALWEG